MPPHLELETSPRLEAEGPSPGAKRNLTWSWKRPLTWSREDPHLELGGAALAAHSVAAGAEG